MPLPPPSCWRWPAPPRPSWARPPSRARSAAGASAARPGLVVTAVNQANGNAWRTSTRADGSYVLAGLPPGSYEIRVGDGQKTGTITVAVGETAAVDLRAGGAGQQITITGTLERKDVRNSEVGTSVSPPAIARPAAGDAQLPVVCRPGARRTPSTSRTGMVIVRGGAQDRNNINVFIDGVSQKNNILRGGALGMDSSRGNPFPQSAVAEYKVVTQNYKAEFDQVSATAITAVTKSGTNELHGELFYDYTDDSLTAETPAEKQNRANGNPRAKFKQQQYGFSHRRADQEGRGALLLCRRGQGDLHPAQRQLCQRQHRRCPPWAWRRRSTRCRARPTRPSRRTWLMLGRLDFELGDDQHLDVTARLRKEDDFIAEDTSLAQRPWQRQGPAARRRPAPRPAPHADTGDQFVNEARVGYELYRWNPHSATSAPLTVWYTSATDLAANGSAVHAFLKTGGSPDAQDRKQTGFLLQNDFTWTALANHTFKAGAKLKFMDYDLGGTSRSVDILHKLIDKDTGNVITGLDAANPTADWFRREAAIAPVGVKYKNNQFGLYLQDDWKLNRHLELNLGVRWDYEDNPLNNSYATPAALVAALNKADITRYGITPATGQTYAQSLAKGGININDYIATGSNRKKFYGALAPRLGFSFDVNGDRATVVYAGYGRAYDRAMANYALDELQRSKGTGDQFMIRNDYKAPFSDQFSLGLRQAVGVWNTEAGVTHTHAKNQFNWYAGDRDPNGGFGPRANSIDPNWGGRPAGLRHADPGRLRDPAEDHRGVPACRQALHPRQRLAGWRHLHLQRRARPPTATGTTTSSTGAMASPGPLGAGTRPSWSKATAWWPPPSPTGLLPWDLALSGKLTLGSGLPYRVTACPLSWDACNSYLGDPSPHAPVRPGAQARA